MNKLPMQIILLLIMTFMSSMCMGYDTDVVHPHLNGNATISSTLNDYLINRLGFNHGLKEAFVGKEVKEWLKEGGKQEDTPLNRSLNHFHDPTKAWDQAGLKGSYVGFSSLLWAQNKSSVSASTEDLGNNGSWPKARTSYYEALTSSDTIVREQKLASTFRSLGQVMHLLADSSVPEHTRNDIHVFPLLDTPDQSYPQIGHWTYETWCKYHDSALNTTAAAVDYISIVGISTNSNLIPIANFWDSTPVAGYNTTFAGLAEYTNFNFVSSDTIFKDYTYPLKPNAFIEDVTAEDGKQDKVIYFKSTTSDGKPINHLASTGYLWAELEQIGVSSMNDSRFELDDNCFKDYADILVPKAVNYTAGLLNYFFRGSIEIIVPDSGFYSAATPTSNGFMQIKMKAKNTTPNDETMPDGTVQLVVKYQPVQDEEFVYQIVMEATGTRTIRRDIPSELTFSLGTPIPVTATDVTLQIVYHGRLGSEDGAVAVGFKDISEPTPIDIYNAMDEICVNGAFYATGSQAAIDAADAVGNKNGVADETDIYAHTAKPVYVKISSARNPQWASPELNDFVVSEITPSTFVRPAYLLVEHEPLGVADFVYSLYDLPEKIDANDTWGHGGMAYLIDGTAYQNQVEYIDNDPTQCDGAQTCSKRVISDPYSFRGNPMWWGGGFIYRNVPYPDGSQCIAELLP